MKKVPYVRFIESKDREARRVDRQALIAASLTADMLPLSDEELAQHPLGLFVVKRLFSETTEKLPTVGYVACRRLINQPETYPGRFALIGNLYLDPAVRGVVAQAAGQAVTLGQKLVYRMTNRTFEEFGEVSMCVAACNDASYNAFYQNGYDTPEPEVAAVLAGLADASIDKKILTVARQDW